MIIKKVKCDIEGIDNCVDIFSVFNIAAINSGWKQKAIARVLGEAIKGDLEHFKTTIFKYCEK
jgi:hypothetical protein